MVCLCKTSSEAEIQGHIQNEYGPGIFSQSVSVPVQQLWSKTLFIWPLPEVPISLLQQMP